ncbi:MAG: anti-sigma factor family protein [Pirellula sp.]|jgi:hypothetical protein
MNEHNIPFDESLISAYLDGELSDQEKHEVESAIRNSPSTQKLVRDLSAVRSMVASTALNSDKLTRSLQHPEWSAPNSNDRVTPTEVSASTPSSQSGVETNRPHISFGFLASLAAIVLILITSKLLIDAEPESGLQVVMEGNTPGSSAPASPQFKSASPNEIPDKADELGVLADSTVAQKAMSSDAAVAMAPMSAELMIDPQMAGVAVPKLSTEAKEFLAYLEQKLNSEPNTQEVNQWRFTTENESKTNAIAESTVRGRENSDRVPIKDVVVELGQSNDEIILQITEDEAKTIFKLANNERELTEVFANEQELLAIATLSTSEEKQTEDLKIAKSPAEVVPGGIREKIWSIDFAPQPTNSVALAAGGNGGFSGESLSAAGMGSAGMSGVGGGFGSNPNEESQRSQSKAPDAAIFSQKSRAMRSADRSETQLKSPTTASQITPGQSTQTLQSAESSNRATDSASAYGASVETLGKEKLKRIRIIIKKEPSSSGSNE